MRTKSEAIEGETLNILVGKKGKQVRGGVFLTSNLRGGGRGGGGKRNQIVLRRKRIPLSEEGIAGKKKST